MTKVSKPVLKETFIEPLKVVNKPSKDYKMTFVYVLAIASYTNTDGKMNYNW